MITLPVDFATNLLANVDTVFTDVSPLLLIAIGIPFGIYVIKLVVGLLPKAKGSK
jgi:hypothetical protein